MLEAQINLNGPDCHLLFPTLRGRLWRERTFYRDAWKPTQEASDLNIRPHECRHSYITHLRAIGINDADLAEIAGHRGRDDASPVHAPVGESYGRVRRALS
jgi:integrase